MAMPKANWSTVLARKRRWLCWTGSSVGARFHSAELQGHMARIPVIFSLATTDAASNMECVSAAEEREHNAACVPGQAMRLHFRQRCCAHQCCLLTRPAAKSCGDLATVLVRLSHLLQGAKQLKDFHAALDQEVDASFRYVPVLRLPRGIERQFPEWIMDASRIAFDLTPEDCQQLLQFFNGSWHDEEMTHYCLQESCPAGCQGESHSRQLAREHVRMAIGMGFTPPLEYRWKGMERACGWALRARGLHRVLDRALARMWSKKQIADAEREAEELGDAAELSYAGKAAIKANSVMRSFAADPQAKLLVKICLCCRPLERALNQLQKADGKVEAYVHALGFAPDSESTQQLRVECIALNAGRPVRVHS